MKPLILALFTAIAFIQWGYFKGPVIKQRYVKVVDVMVHVDSGADESAERSPDLFEMAR